MGVADNGIWDELFSNLDQCIARRPHNDVLLISTDTNSNMVRASYVNSLLSNSCLTITKGKFNVVHV